MITPKHTIYWTKEKCQEEALKYKTRGEFYKVNNSAYYASHKNGWFDEICIHMIEVRKPNGYWTYDKCQVEALKYETINEFKKGSGGAYYRASKNKWVDEFFPKVNK